MNIIASGNFSQRSWRLGAVSVCCLLVSACAALQPEAMPSSPTLYSLDNAIKLAPIAPRTEPAATAPTLLITSPRAAAGFDSSRIIYLRETHKLEYFARSEWVDTPARMLTPLLVGAVENSGAFRVVVHAPSSASGDLRLDTEILQLQQEFEGGTSRVRFVLRAYLVEDASRRVLASHEFEALAAAPSADPYGGVVAANQAVRSVLEKLAAFCADAGGNWRPKDPDHRSTYR